MAGTSDPHLEFLSWSEKNGIYINGVLPAKTQGQGMGIVAGRDIEEGETIVQVPTKTLFTIRSVPAEFRRTCPGLSVHGMFAAYMASEASFDRQYGAWKATWPSEEVFAQSMPLRWPSTTIQYLPAEAEELLDKQRLKFRRDFDVAKLALTDLNESKYLHLWLLVNTRSFYYEFAGAKQPRFRDDRMVLCPFIDYFNHQDHGCGVTFDQGGFTVTTKRIYKCGEEVYTSYGAHTNDFLLVEYGFCLTTNKWDSVRIDDVVDDILSAQNKQRLEAAGYFGDYHLTAKGVCFRTQVAVRTQTLDHSRWTKYLSAELRERREEEVQADACIAQHLLKKKAQQVIKMVEFTTRALETSSDASLRTILERWLQLKDLLHSAHTTGISEIAQTAYPLLP